MSTNYCIIQERWKSLQKVILNQSLFKCVKSYFQLVISYYYIFLRITRLLFFFFQKPVISCVSYCLQLFSHNNRLSFSSTGKNFQKISIDQPKIKEPTPVRDSLAPLPNHCAQRCKYRQTFATISCCT